MNFYDRYDEKQLLEFLNCGMFPIVHFLQSSLNNAMKI